MPPPLKPGANVALSKEVPGLRTVAMGVAWDVPKDDVLRKNLVVAALLCDQASNVLSDEHFVFFNQLVSADGSVGQLQSVLGDDDEQIEVDLEAVPPAVARIVVVLYLNGGTELRRTLGQLRSCRVRVIDVDRSTELCRSEELSGMLGTSTAVVLGELYRHSTGWKFKVVAGAYPSIVEVAAHHGLPL